MGLLKRKTPEEKAAAKATKAEKKARDRAIIAKWDADKKAKSAARWEGLAAKMESKVDKWDQEKQDKPIQRRQRIMDQLQPDETVEAEFRTAEAIMKKDLIFTSKRLIVARTGSEDFESIPYRAVTGFTTGNFITKDINLRIADRRDKLDLLFNEAADRDRALEILNTYAL